MRGKGVKEMNVQCRVAIVAVGCANELDCCVVDVFKVL